MSAIRIYSLMTQEQVYEWGLDEYGGEVGASGGHMPTLEIMCLQEGKYVVVVVEELSLIHI